jgi:hypothetical protein
VKVVGGIVYRTKNYLKGAVNLAECQQITNTRDIVDSRTTLVEDYILTWGLVLKPV